MNDYLISYYFQCSKDSGFGNITITIDKVALSDLNAITDIIKNRGKEIYRMDYKAVTIFNIVKLDKE